MNLDMKKPLLSKIKYYKLTSYLDKLITDEFLFYVL